MPRVLYSTKEEAEKASGKQQTIVNHQNRQETMNRQETSITDNNQPQPINELQQDQHQEIQRQTCCSQNFVHFAYGLCHF